MDGEGNFVAAWSESDPGAPHNTRIRARYYDSEGHPRDVPFQVNTNVIGQAPSSATLDVAMGANGGVVVGWTNGLGNETTDIGARRFNDSRWHPARQRRMIEIRCAIAALFSPNEDLSCDAG